MLPIVGLPSQCAKISIVAVFIQDNTNETEDTIESGPEEPAKNRTSKSTEQHTQRRTNGRLD